MFGLVTVRYSTDPIMLWYSFYSMASSSSASRVVVVDIGIERGLALPISNFFSRSLVYLP
jgi:hypothetical protein